MQSYFDETTMAVDKRCHTGVLHMPFTISYCHLRELIANQLNEKFPEGTPSVPSLECIRLQFWLANPYTERALHYTEQFKVKFGIQIR